MFSEMQSVVLQLSLKVSQRRCCCPCARVLDGTKAKLANGPFASAQIRPISTIKKLRDITKIKENTSAKPGKNADQRSTATFHMFWDDSQRIFGNVLAVSQVKEPAARSLYATNARQVEYAKTRGRMIDARKLFDEQTALMYGTRLSNMPEELGDFYVTADSDRKKKGPGVAPVPPEVHDDLFAMGTPDGSMEIAVDAYFAGLPEFSDLPIIKSSAAHNKPAKESAVEKVKKPERKKVWVTEDQDAEPHTPKLPVRKSKAKGTSENILRKEKPVKIKSQTVLKEFTKRVPVPRSNFRIVQLKKESDLKSLAQSPLLNKLRPDYVDDESGFSLPTPMVLQISPEDLTSVPLTPEGYPSVTTILDVTMAPESRARLDAWRRKKIEELGVDGFQKYQQLIFANGKSFHTAVESVLHGADLLSVEVPKPVEGYWESLRPVLEDVSDVRIIEEKIVHPFLCYKGVTDSILRLDGNVTLVDWKTSGTKKDTAAALYDNPLQVAAYMGAVNFDEKFDERQWQIANGAVVVAYASGEPASVIHFDLNLARKYWAQWLRRLQQFWRLAAAEKAIPQRIRDD